jgi:hypothetical protein
MAGARRQAFSDLISKLMVKFIIKRLRLIKFSFIIGTVEIEAARD